MKNKFLNLLVATMVVGAMLVGCGGNEAGTETGANSGSGVSTSTELNVSTEVNVNTEESNPDDNTTEVAPDIEYTETSIAFLAVNEADIDKSMTDGTEVPNTTAENVQQIVKVKAKVDLYNKSKERIGYLKDGVTIAFVNIDNEWCIIGSTDYSEIYYALATDMIPIIEVVDDTGSGVESDEKDSVAMSDRAKAFLDEVRKGIADVNEQVVEADSSNGMECLGTLAPDFDGKFGVRDVITYITEPGYSQYYIEYLKETDTYVEFKLYAK